MLVETKSYLVDIDCNKGKYWAINNADQINRVLDHLKNCKDEVLGKLFPLFRSDTTGRATDLNCDQSISKSWVRKIVCSTFVLLN